MSWIRRVRVGRGFGVESLILGLFGESALEWLSLIRSIPNHRVSVQMGVGFTESESVEVESIIRVAILRGMLEMWPLSPCRESDFDSIKFRRPGRHYTGQKRRHQNESAAD